MSTYWNPTYKAAKETPLNENWQPPRDRHVDSEMSGEISTIRARCRDLCRNNAHAAGVITTLIDYVGSTGLSPVNGDQGCIDVWNEWSHNCHINGCGTWESTNRDIIGAETETGDILLMTPIIQSAEGVKTRIDLVEGDRVRTPQKFQEKGKDIYGNEVRYGVSYRDGIEVGYWVAKIDPRTSGYLEGGQENYWYMEANKNGRYNARLIRRPDKLRPGQSRQMPLFVSVAQQFWDIDALWDAAINRARALSLIAAFIESSEPDNINDAMGVVKGSAASQYTDNWSNPLNIGSIPTGSMIKVPPGTTASMLTPSGNIDLDVLIIRATRIMGAAIGMPYELISRDFSKTNFSSGKLAHDGFFRLVDRWNRGNAEQYANPLYKLVCTEAWLNGDSRVSDLTPEKLNVQWIGGPRSYNANPQSEASANETLLNNNQTTEEILAAENGRNLRDIYESNARAIQLQKELESKYGLESGTLSRRTTVNPTQKQVEENNVEKEKEKSPEVSENE